MAEQNTKHPAARSGAGEIEQLYFRNFPFILETALEDSRLTQADAWDVVDGVTKYLPKYHGDLTDDDFQQWVADVIAPAVAFIGLMRDAEPVVYKAIWSVLRTCDGLGCDDRTANDIASTVWLWALQNLDDLKKPNQPAKLSSRLYAKARWAARAEKTRRVRAKQRFMDNDLVAKMGRDETGALIMEPQNAP